MLEIKNKIEFENNLWVGEVDVSKANNSQEERVKFVTDISSICYGRLGFLENNVSDVLEVTLNPNIISNLSESLITGNTPTPALVSIS